MRSWAKSLVRSLVSRSGYEIVKKKSNFPNVAELDIDENRLIQFILSKNLSMVSENRLINTLLAVKHVSEMDVEGAFVECGTWRGGNGILASKIFEKYSQSRELYLFDTFEGMSAPSLFDYKNSMAHDPREGLQQTNEIFNKSLNAQGSYWCLATIEEVTQNFAEAGARLDGVHFIKGKVEDTLKDDKNLPDKIAVLRLDTDWYDSTKVELEYLWPRVVQGGILILDDYGHWNGAKKAVDEFFNSLDRPFLSYSDYTGRVGVKIN